MKYKRIYYKYKRIGHDKEKYIDVFQDNGCYVLPVIWLQINRYATCFFVAFLFWSVKIGGGILPYDSPMCEIKQMEEQQ